MKAKRADQTKNTTKIRTDVIRAALNLAASEPWQFVAPYDIAHSAGITVAEMEKIFPDKGNILEAIIDDLDTQVEIRLSEPDFSIPMRDRLFDVLMERLEVANIDRAAHISFFKSFGWTKSATCHDMALMRASMTRMAKLAGMEVDGPLGAIRMVGLTTVYGWVLLTWIKDDSRDLSRTMAQLDKTLGYAERAANYF